MASDIIKNWDTDLVDVVSASVANKIAELKGGESITIKSLAASTEFHYIGLKHLCEKSRGYKLQGGESMTLTLPIEFGADNKIEIYAMATNAGDDITYFKLIDMHPETNAES